MSIEKKVFEKHITPTRDKMGSLAARAVAKAMRKYISRNGSVSMVFAAAPSQNEFLFHLSKQPGLDWSKVVAMHLDEYIDLERGHPNTFESYLNEHVFGIVSPGTIHYMKALIGLPQELCRSYAELVAKHGINIACIGIGENGHIAFNEPGSLIDDPERVRLITLDRKSVMQQYKDYKDHPNPLARYKALDDVPRNAVTLTIPAILSADEIYVIVPGQQKASAVRKMWEGPVDASCPSSALRLHSYVKFYFDSAAASKLQKNPGVR